MIGYRLRRRYVTLEISGGNTTMVMNGLLQIHVFVPELAKLIGACPTYHLSSSIPDEQEDLAQKLPRELWSHLLHMLDKIDIAKACIAIPSLQEIGHTILLDKLKQDMLFLWELYSDAPYSNWAGIRAAEVEEAIISYEIDVSERAAVLQIL